MTRRTTHILSSNLICAFMARERERETDRQSEVNDVTD